MKSESNRINEGSSQSNKNGKFSKPSPNNQSKWCENTEKSILEDEKKISTAIGMEKPVLILMNVETLKKYVFNVRKTDIS